MLPLSLLLGATLLGPALCRPSSGSGSPFRLLPFRSGAEHPNHTTETDSALSYPLSVQFSAGPSTEGAPASIELVAARRALKKLKELLGPAQLRALLANDIQAGTAGWHSILTAANRTDNGTSPDPGTRVLAEVRFTAVPPDPEDCSVGGSDGNKKKVDFGAANFVAWFANSAFKHVDNLWRGHPEHYGIDITQNADGTLGAQVLEPWGPLMTASKVPRLAPVTGVEGGGVKKAWFKSLPEFPYQSVGDETLTDGSEAVFGHLHYSFRDLPVGDGTQGGATCGIEVALNIWMPSGTPDDVREGIAQHLKIEYYNWVGWAFEDIKAGVFVPSSPAA